MGTIWDQLAAATRAPQVVYKPLTPRQLEANGIYAKPKPKAKPKAKAKPKPVVRRAAPRATPYAAPRASSGGGGGGGSIAPALPVSSGSMAGAAPAQSTAALLASLKRQAHDQVSMELDPEIQARQFAYNQARSAYGSQVNDTKKQLGLTKTELTQLYGSLDVLLQNTQNKSAAAMETGRAGSNAAYDKLAQQVSGTYGQAGQNVSAELARLGQGGADVQGRLAADQAAASTQVGAQKANASSTIDAIKAAAAGEGAQMRGAAAATGPALIAQAQFKADDQLGKLRTDYNQTIQQLTFQIKQLSGSRKGKEAAALRELQAAQAQAEQDAQQLQFMNSIRAAQVGISQGQLDLAKQRLSSDVLNQQNSLVLRAKELQAKLDAQKPGAKPQTGMEKAYSYLGSYKGRVPQAQLQQALEDAINGNSNDPGWNPGKPVGPGNIPGYDPKYIDQYKRDIASAVAGRGWTPAERNALLNAVNYYFGR